jgi:hypothetical protein
MGRPRPSVRTSVSTSGSVSCGRNRKRVNTEVRGTRSFCCLYLRRILALTLAPRRESRISLALAGSASAFDSSHAG